MRTFRQLMRSRCENGGSRTTLCREKTQRSRTLLVIRYDPSSFTKKRRSRSGDTSAADGLRVQAGARFGDRRVAQIRAEDLNRELRGRVIAENSRSAIASEYASSPPAHPATHARSGVSGACPSISRAKPSPWR